MQSILHDLHLDIGNPWLAGAVSAVLVALVFFVVFVAGRKVVVATLNKAINSFQKEPHETIALTLFRILRLVGLLVAFDLIVESLPIPERLSLWISNAIFVLLALIFAAALFDLVNVLGEVLRNRAREFETLITKLAKILIATITLMVIMKHFDYDIWHILTALGVGTLAVGLAAQPTLTNMIAGFTILLDRPFRRGDHISLSGGDIGDVTHIGMRSTQIKTSDGNMLIVSNSELVNSRVINYSMPDEHFAQKVRFFFDHASDLSLLKTFILERVTKVPGVVKGSASVYAVAVNDWAIEIDVFYQVESFNITSKVTDQIIHSITEEMKTRQVRFATNPNATLPKN